MSFIDLTGQKFGKLVVLLRSENAKNRSARWICLCSCGNRTVVNAGSLKSGNVKSCGCLKKYSDKSLSSKNALYYNYIKKAEKRNLIFNLKFEEFIKLTQKRCYFCGKEPEQFLKVPDAREGFFYNGVDRLNNNQGYNKNNVVSCCKCCNCLKWDRSKEDFIVWLKKCYTQLNLNKK